MGIIKDFLAKALIVIKDFFARKTISFYIGAFAALLSLISSIIYIVGFNPDSKLGEYTSYGVFVLTLLAFFAFTGLSLFKQTSRLAAPVMTLLVFIAFIIFAIDGYEYFPEVFFGGFNLAGLFSMEFAFLFCLLSFIIIIIAGSVCIYLKQEKQEKTQSVSEVKA